jgi:hypothetical protein
VRHLDCKHQRQVDLDGELLPCAWPDCPAGRARSLGSFFRTYRVTMSQSSYWTPPELLTAGPQVDMTVWKREEMQELSPAASHALPWEDKFRRWFFWRLTP